MALPCVPPSNLIVNVVCGRGRIRSSVLPERFKDARVRLILKRSIPVGISLVTFIPLNFYLSRW